MVKRRPVRLRSCVPARVADLSEIGCGVPQATSAALIPRVPNLREVLPNSENSATLNDRVRQDAAEDRGRLGYPL